VKKIKNTIIKVSLTIIEWAVLLAGVVYENEKLGNVFAAWSFVFPVLISITFVMFILAAATEKSGLAKIEKPLKKRLLENKSLIPSWFHAVSRLIISAILFYNGWFWCGGAFSVGTFISWMTRGAIDAYRDKV